LLALPSTLPDPERHTQGQWHCDTCEPSQPPAKRLAWRCGYLPREQWPASRDGLPKTICGVPYTADVCPGWLVRRPIVTEASEAFQASESGLLSRWDPHELRVVTLAVMAAKRGMNLNEMDKARRAAARVRSA
jgi:hypothetical protein